MAFHFYLPLRPEWLSFLNTKCSQLRSVLWLTLKSAACRVSEMAQRVRVLATKLTTLSSVPGTHMVEGEN